MANKQAAPDLIHEAMLDVIDKQGARIDRSDISANASLSDDLGFDLLDTIELVMELEDRFKINIDDNIASGWTTVGEIETYLRSSVRT